MKKPLIIGAPEATTQFAASAGLDEQFRRQLEGFSLTTARIFYHLPDAPGILQEYIWQEQDVAPDFPVLKKFLDFWKENLDGKLHSVIVGHSTLLKPAELKMLDAQFTIN